MVPNNFTLFIPLLNNFIDHFITLRQYCKLNKAEPASAKLIFTEDKFTEAVTYNKVKIIYKSLTGFIGAVIDMVILYYSNCVYTHYFANKKYSDTLFSVSLMILNMTFNLPFDMFYDFVIEAKFGYNKKTIMVFVKDACLQLSLSAVLCTPFFMIIFYAAKKYFNFYLFVWVIMAFIKIFLIAIYPTVIAPLFPLEDGELKSKIEELADKVKFKIDKIHVMDGSKRSGHSNAYFTGFGKMKKIVFYDTILQQLSDNQILAVLCHELGHWSACHTLYLTIMGLVQLFAYLYLFNYFIAVSSAEPICIRYLKFSTIYSCLEVPLKLIINLIIRAFERQADRFAISQGYGQDLKAGLIKLHSENKGQPIVDHIYSAVHNSHPHTLDRIETINFEMNKNK